MSCTARPSLGTPLRTVPSSTCRVKITLIALGCFYVVPRYSKISTFILITTRKRMTNTCCRLFSVWCIPWVANPIYGVRRRRGQMIHGSVHPSIWSKMDCTCTWSTSAATIGDSDDHTLHGTATLINVTIHPPVPGLMGEPCLENDHLHTNMAEYIRGLLASSGM